MKTFAAIYIGSYEISLKIFELTAKRGVREIDHLRHRMELGKDIYGCGYIGYEMADELCDVLTEFTGVMKSYRVDAYEAYCGPIMKDAQNELFILDQIRIRTKLEVKILSNSEHRFISYKSVASTEEFDRMTEQGAAVVDVGGASLQITLFIQGHVVTTQHLVLGIMRLREKLSDVGISAAHYETLIEELVDKELEVFKALYLKNKEIKYIILMGDYSTEIMRKLQKDAAKKQIEAPAFVKFTQKLSGMGLEEIAEELNLSNERDPLAIPALVMYRRVVQELDGNIIYVPGLNINDGIAYDYAQKNNILKVSHDFEADVLSASEHLSKRYFGYEPHIKALEQMALRIFDTTKRIHGMGTRERLLLQAAAILHDCGKYVSLVNGPQCSYDIIMSSEIIGLTHLEREIVASTVLYNTQQIDSYDNLADKLDEKSYMIVSKLAAILKVSNAMDRSHKQKFKTIKVAVSGRNLNITIETMDDITLEKGLFEAKSAFFEEVFSLKPVIKVKKVYS